MSTLGFIVSYPFSWFLCCLLVAAIFTYKQSVKLAICMGIISLLIGVSILPIGSNIWLKSLVYNFNGENTKCDPFNLPDEGILLPGGVVNVGADISLTNWSKQRVESFLDYNKKGISKLYIPSGELFHGKREGEYIKEAVMAGTEFNINIYLGMGSRSTFENFLEIKNLLDKDKEYVLFTSAWHAYRATSVAKKMDIRVCTIGNNIPNEAQALKEYPWKFKAALREYLAIILYSISGQI